MTPVSPYAIFTVLSKDGSGSLIVTGTFTGVWVDGHPYTSCRVQNTSAQVCHVTITTPKGNLASGTVAASFDHTFAQAALGGWSLGDGASVDNVTWT